MYDRDTTKWESADGNTYLVKDLSTPHLVNILNWVRKHKLEKYNHHYGDGLYPFLESEARLRTMLSFCKNEPIPVKQADGWYTLSNIGFWARMVSLFYKHRTELMIKHNERKIVGKLLKFILK